MSEVETHQVHLCGPAIECADEPAIGHAGTGTPGDGPNILRVVGTETERDEITAWSVGLGQQSEEDAVVGSSHTSGGLDAGIHRASSEADGDTTGKRHGPFCSGGGDQGVDCNWNTKGSILDLGSDPEDGEQTPSQNGTGGRIWIPHGHDTFGEEEQEPDARRRLGIE